MIKNPKAFSSTEITSVAVDVVAGAAGYVNTDVSAITGLLSRSWLISAYVGGGAYVGARAVGSALNPKAYANSSTLIIGRTVAGHIELLRDAALTLTYRFIGYLS
jgi:hypothetical protein